MEDKERELYTLVLSSGHNIDYDLFKVILDLLKLDVNPDAILKILNKIASKQKRAAAQNEYTNQQI